MCEKCKLSSICKFFEPVVQIMKSPMILKKKEKKKGKIEIDSISGDDFKEEKRVNKEKKEKGRKLGRAPARTNLKVDNYADLKYALHIVRRRSVENKLNENQQAAFDCLLENAPIVKKMNEGQKEQLLNLYKDTTAKG